MLTRLKNVLISKIFVFFLLFISASHSSHAATVYRWVDDQGQSHFGSAPPKNTQTERVQIRKSGSKAPALTSNLSPNSEENADSVNDENEQEKGQETEAGSESEAVQKKSKYTQEERAKYCQQSRNLSTRMNGNLQRRVEQPDGSYRKLNESEINKYKAQAKTGISSYCQ
mgnify:CR=1 FL=1